MALTPSSRLSQLTLDSCQPNDSPRTRYFACQPAEDFTTKWERTFSSEHQQHPNLSMVLDSDKICFEHRSQATQERFTIDTLFDMEMQFSEQYLYKDEHYDPTASWLDEIYCEEDEDDGDVTMEEEDDDNRATTINDEEEDEDEENRPPRQWRSRRHQKSRIKQPQMIIYQHHSRAPLQELPLDDDEDDQEQGGGFPRKKKNTTRRGSFRLMRSLSPPAASNRNASAKY
ncbi:hypothetical protein K492DRAFT_170870 [Lichtheimia hyalospora FSU 10163]|nr:hypothetical protein K492DRAFT_170870 [Lichtheimia hyalospora FSU 10163]